MNSMNYGYGYNYPNYQPITTGMNWVQGEAGANAFQVQPGQLAVLFDSTQNIFYIKTVDASGKPNPLEVYDYSKHENKAEPDMSQYVTRDELNKILEGEKHE